MLNRRALLQGIVGAGAMGGVAATEVAVETPSEVDVKPSLPLIERRDGESENEFYLRRYHDFHCTRLFWQYTGSDGTKRLDFGGYSQCSLLAAVGLLLSDTVLEQYHSDFGITARLDVDLILAYDEQNAVRYMRITHHGDNIRTCGMCESVRHLNDAVFAMDFRAPLRETPTADRVSITPLPPSHRYFPFYSTPISAGIVESDPSSKS